MGAVFVAALSANGPIRACSTVGHVYVGPIELNVSPEVDAVAACIGENCTPVEVTRGPDGRWLVPQERPYLQGDDELRGNVRQVTVRTESAGRVVANGLFEVGRVQVPGSEGPECPLVQYAPVVVH